MCGLTVVGPKEKKKEKKNVQEAAGWATTHFWCCSTIQRLYRDIAGHRRAGERIRGLRQSNGERALFLATGVCRDTIVCIMTEGRPYVAT